MGVGTCLRHGVWATVRTWRQMHDDACSNRVPQALVEAQLANAIEKLKSLTSAAAAAGCQGAHAAG